jgi:hypothetical protein
MPVAINEPRRIPAVNPQVSRPTANPTLSRGACSATKTQAPGASDRRPLQDAKEQKQQWSGNPNGSIGWQASNEERRNRHEQYAEHEDALASVLVAEMGHDQAAQRTRQIAGGKNPKGLGLTDPIRLTGGEEHLSDRRSEKYKDDEVVEFECPANRRKPERAQVSTHQGVRRSDIGLHEGILLFLL